MKHKIRKELLCKRENGDGLAEKNEAIAEKLLQQPEYQRAKKVMLYFSIGSEVDTCAILEHALKEKEVYLPFVENGEMGFAKVSSLDELDPGEYGIPEPVDKQKNDPAILDLVVVPGIAFDENGHRVGYGGGYYDKFLPTVEADTIGLAYDFQIVEEIPAEHHDQPVKKIVTEERVITC